MRILRAEGVAAQGQIAPRGSSQSRRYGEVAVPNPPLRTRRFNNKPAKRVGQEPISNKYDNVEGAWRSIRFSAFAVLR
jgi:hypothetical protein